MLSHSQGVQEDKYVNPLPYYTGIVQDNVITKQTCFIDVPCIERYTGEREQLVSVAACWSRKTDGQHDATKHSTRFIFIILDFKTNLQTQSIHIYV